MRACFYCGEMCAHGFCGRCERALPEPEPVAASSAPAEQEAYPTPGRPAPPTCPTCGVNTMMLNPIIQELTRVKASAPAETPEATLAALNRHNYRLEAQVVALQAERDALTAENARLRRKLRRIQVALARDEAARQFVITDVDWFAQPYMNQAVDVFLRAALASQETKETGK